MSALKRSSFLFLFSVLLLHSQPQGPTVSVAPGPTLPARCSPNAGQVFFKTTATIGLYFCSSTNTWTIVSQTPGTGITALNADSTSTHTFTVGTSGTDVNMSNPGGGNHVINIPVASSTVTGKLSSANWTTFNNKIDPSGSYNNPSWITGLAATKLNSGLIPTARYIIGTPADNDCMKYDATNGALTSAGQACGSGSGTGLPANCSDVGGNIVCTGPITATEFISSSTGTTELLFTEGTVPGSNPAAGKQKLWLNVATHGLELLNSSGVSTPIGSGGGGLPAGCTSPGTGAITCTGTVTADTFVSSNAGTTELSFKEGTIPANPSATNFKMWVNSSTHVPEFLNSTGTSTPFLMSGAVTTINSVSCAVNGTCTVPTGSGTPTYVNVKDNGVKGDGITLTNVTTTASSTTVTRASGSWTALDVGKLFSCLGAGAGGINLNTTIASFVNSTTVTLTTAPSTSIAGTATCTYATDDWAAISNVASGNRPGTLFFPKGIYGISQGIAWFNQLSAKGAGIGKTVIMAMYSGDMNAAMINATGSAAAPITDIEISDIEFSGQYWTQSTYNIAGKAIAIIHMLRAKIHDVYAHDFPATCIGPDELADSLIYNNRVHNCGMKNDGTQGGGNGIGFSLLDDTNEGGNIYGNICSNAKRYCIMLEAGAGVNRTARWNITGNECHIDAGFGGPTGTGCILDGGTNGTHIADNRLYGPTDVANVWGVVVNRSSTGTTPGIRTTIQDNHITGFDACISVDHTTTAPSVTPHNYKIEGNECRAPRSEGIRIVAHGTTPMVGVEVSHNTVINAGNAGIEFSGAAGIQKVITNGNTLIGNGQTTANSWEASGIAANTNITKWVAHSNTAYDDGSTKQLYGMSANAKTLSNVDWRNNILTDNVTGATFFTGSTITGTTVLGVSGTAPYFATTAETGALRPAGTPACYDGASNLTGDSGVCGSFAPPTNSWSWVGPSSTLDAGTISTTETAHNVNITIPANTLAVGTTYRLTSFFQDVTPATNTSRNPKLYLKKSGAGGFGTAIYTSAASSPGASSTRGVGVDVYIRCLTTGVTGTVEVWTATGSQFSNNTGINTVTQPVTIDTTADTIIQWTQTFGAANAGNTDTLRRMGLVQLP